MENSWVFFELDRRQFGLRTENVREMVLFKDVTRLPETPDYFRGVVNLRGGTVATVDLRKRLGMKGLQEATEELIELLMQREQDHINWLNELLASVHEDREFKLTTDPHQCKFGKWYDSFHTNDPLLQFQLGKFDSPHKRIHVIGIQAKELVASGKKNEAVKLVDSARGHDLALLLRLFADTRQLIRENTREIMLIVEAGQKRTGFVVDHVTEVSDIQPENTEPPPEITHDQTGNLILGLAKVNQEVRILLDAEKLLETEEWGQVTI